jgi:uncharacterized membrane protein YhaH (DUF805 family)
MTQNLHMQTAPDLAGAPLGPGAAISSAFRNMFSFKGRASRSAYWWFWLFAVVATFVVGSITSLAYILLVPSATLFGANLAATLPAIPFAIALLALAGRRLHDSGKSAALLWLMVLPFGSFAIFVMMFLAPKEPNPYTPEVDAAPVEVPVSVAVG